MSYKFMKCYYYYRGWKWFLSASADLHINFFKQNKYSVFEHFFRNEK